MQGRAARCILLRTCPILISSRHERHRPTVRPDLRCGGPVFFGGARWGVGLSGRHGAHERYPRSDEASGADPQHTGGDHRHDSLLPGGTLFDDAFLPLAAGSIPLAFVGGYVTLPSVIYKQIVGVVLLLAALRLLWSAFKGAATEPEETPAKPALAVVSGAGIGLLAGLTGTGGGIFLTPFLLFMRWAKTKRAAAVSVAFILVNSVAGLLGHLANIRTLPTFVGYWAVAAVAGGLLGSELGSKRLEHPALRFLLGCVLLVAAGKMMLV